MSEEIKKQIEKNLNDRNTLDAGTFFGTTSIEKIAEENNGEGNNNEDNSDTDYTREREWYEAGLADREEERKGRLIAA